MQSVSTAYKNSMKSPLRNRGYIQVSFGIFNEAAQADAQIVNNSNTYIYYSDASEVFHNQPSDFVYATLENHFFRVDGSQHFLPPVSEPQLYRNTGLISQNLVNNGNVYFEIRLSEARTWYGLTIDFGYNFPTSFDIIYGSNTLQVRNNTKSVYVADVAFESVDTIQIVFRSMRESSTRARVYSIQFGIGYVYGNDSVMDSSLNRQISPICEYIPQFDFSVKLKNYDHYFDVDNPNSAINFLTQNQKISVQYGYELDSGRIEWIPGQTLYCTEWESDNTSATIRCCDILRNLDNEYHGGTYDPDGQTFADLAETIFEAAGITDYYLDPVLSDLTTKIPIPRISYKEALQLIANACCCILTFGRDGKPEIRKLDYSSIPNTFRMSKQDMKSYPVASKNEAVKDIVVEYQSWFQNASEINLMSEELTVEANEERTYYFVEPCYDFKIKVDGVDLTSTILQDSGDYYVSLKFPSGSTVALDIYGKKYSIVSRKYNYPVSDYGKTIIWSNPLLDGISMAYPLAQWLGVYYGSQIEYEYDSRGNPELDVGDKIFQDNEYMNNMWVLITEYILNFKQAFSAHAVTRKIGGS